MNIEFGAIGWLLCNIFSIIVLAFFSMMEMACVSFNRIRLQYYVSKGMRRAIWLQELLKRPTSLFGTTLTMVNIALIVGSQFSRDHYAALGLSPDLAPITQIVLVVIFGELAPMFAARHYAESVALLGIPILYAFSWILAPFLWIIQIVSSGCNWLLGGKEESAAIFLNIEELQKVLQKVLEEQDEERLLGVDSEELHTITTNIFQLRQKSVQQLMVPLKKIVMLPSNATVGQMRHLVRLHGTTFIPIYYRNIHNIVGIAYCKDLLSYGDEEPLQGKFKSPWYVLEKASLMQILKEFRTNRETVAVILNSHGQANGITLLKDVAAEIFGKALFGEMENKRAKIIVDRTFPAETTVKQVNSQLGVVLDQRGQLTLLELMQQELGHSPELGDNVSIGPFDLTVKEVSLLLVKSIGIVTHH